jgi:hypothetical protein
MQLRLPADWCHAEETEYRSIMLACGKRSAGAEKDLILSHLLANPSDVRIMHRIPRHNIDDPVIFVRSRFEALPP